MLVFRSEDHVAKWCEDWRFKRGAMLTLGQCWRLARAWYSADRRDPSWRRFSAREAHEIFTSLELTGDFWRLD
ncbi:MAG: hypothetical protein JOY87_09535 [Candidatus Eremiobacteraeota bacterium]|nr:hypothetical protein [Candidatus Eremiobacteraeota bacterium]MBV8340344.1 hypothetical protein [Candidatus Eremiobacteraeota bacterium]MBV8668452.1 hypothetical protein [Candidatus Eremiobacteraeota bacterium]MBV8671441.1 hypothetical protein [Candidatus Eremiobacteraeota bacterium]